MTPLPPPFPDRLRRRTARRRLGAWPLVALAIALAVLAVPHWRVEAVSLEGCPGLPESVQRDLATMVGSPVATLDLDWVRSLVGAWPAVAGVDVRLELPGTLEVRARPTQAVGSVRLGRRWLAIDPQGAPAGVSAGPLLPVLEGFPSGQRGRALAVADRLERSSGATVRSLRWVLPEDVEAVVVVPGSELEATVHVRFEPTSGERWWASEVAAGRPPVHTDARSEHRVVVAEGGPS